MSPTFKALTVHNYRLYLSGTVISNVGTWMQRVAQDWLVLQLTGSSAKLGITTGLQFLPFLLVTPIAGLIADRYSKRHMRMLTQGWLAITAAALGVLALTGTVQTWHVYVLAFLFGVGTAFDGPARQSFVSEMVGPDLVPNAVALNSATFNLGRLAGPGVAGVLIAAFGGGVNATGGVIMLNALSYLAVIWSLAAMRGRELFTTPPVARAKHAVRDGVAYVRRTPELVFIFVVALFAGTFGLNFQMTTALMATSEFHRGAGQYGALGSALAVGSVIGALWAARHGYPRQLRLVLAGTSFACAEIAAGLMPSYLTFAVFLPVVGVTSMIMLNGLMSTVQLTATDEIRGRVLALYMMVLMGGKPLGAPVLGWIGEVMGARWTLLVGGLATLGAVVGATVWLIRVRHINVREVSMAPARIPVWMTHV